MNGLTVCVRLGVGLGGRLGVTGCVGRAVAVTALVAVAVTRGDIALVGLADTFALAVPVGLAVPVAIEVDVGEMTPDGEMVVVGTGGPASDVDDELQAETATDASMASVPHPMAVRTLRTETCDGMVFMAI
jgi:hypothetical protein